MKKHLRSKCFFSYIRRAASYIAFGSDIRLSPGDIRFASFSANIISLRRRRNITFAVGRNITPNEVRHITDKKFTNALLRADTYNSKTIV